MGPTLLTYHTVLLVDWSELSHVICQISIVFFWIGFLIDLRVMMLLRGVVLSFAPCLAETSAISFPLISAYPPIGDGSVSLGYFFREL